MLRVWQIMVLWMACLGGALAQTSPVLLPFFGLPAYQNRPLQDLVSSQEVRSALDVLMGTDARTCFNSRVSLFPNLVWNEARSELSTQLLGVEHPSADEAFFSINARGEIHSVIQCEFLFASDKVYQYFTNTPFDSPPSTAVVDFLWTIKANRFPIIRSDGKNFSFTPLLLSDTKTQQQLSGNASKIVPGRSLQEALENYQAIQLSRLWRCQTSGQGVVPDVEMLYFNTERDFVSKTNQARAQGVFRFNGSARLEINLLGDSGMTRNVNSLQLSWTTLNQQRLEGSILDRRNGILRLIKCDADSK